MNQIVTDGIILSRINYQEADRIITFLTVEGTKIRVMAKGVRRAKSKLAGSVELFCICQVTYLPGNTGLGTLISARLKNYYKNIVKDLERTQWAYEVLKYLNKYTEESSSMEIYELLEIILASLDDLSIPLDLIRAWFGIRFLEAMGHSPNLAVEPGDPGELSYRFDIDKMQFLADRNGPNSVNQIKLLRLLDSNLPVKINKIANLETLLPKSIGLIQTMMGANGFGLI
jgi:DNA repair protein RecO